MIRTLQIALLCLTTLAAASCAREHAGGDGRVSFSIVPTVAQAPAAEILQSGSRAKVTDAFPAGTMIGLHLSAPFATPALSPIYDNFFALFNGATWLYYLDNVNAGDRLSGFASWGMISVSGYYPYSNTVTDLSQIPFRIASMNGAVAEATETSVATDYMAAETQTKDMSSPSAALSLRFRHMMTAIDLEVGRSISSVPVLRLSDATFEISGGTPSREFTISGTYNAIDPDMGDIASNFTPEDTAATMFVTYPSAPNMNSRSVYTILLAMMPELRQKTTADDATVTITFRFLDQDGYPYSFEDVAGGNPSVTFKLSDIVNAGNDNGLLAGWTYKVKATLGYYTKFFAPTDGTPMPPHVNRVDLVDDPGNEFVDI